MPIDMSGADNVLKNLYGPAMEEQLRERLIISDLMPGPIVIETYPRWRVFLITAKERLNSCYMHIRYGECDDAREWHYHDC